MRRTSAFREARTAWLELLGEDRVCDDPEELVRAGTATFPTTHGVAITLRPQCTRHVVGICEIAARHNVAIFPISGGRNWGLGSRVPSSDGAALVLLSDMNGILEYNPSLAYVTVEPGVTFASLHEFLQHQGDGLYFPAIGGPADASVVANVLERGDGIGPGGTRSDAVCNQEVVLPNGGVIRTGHGRYAHATSGAVSRHGVGPSYEGLFAQSNLGITTRMTVWLVPRPSVIQIAQVQISNVSSLSRTIDSFRELLLKRVFEGTSISVWNEDKFAMRRPNGERRNSEGWRATGIMHCFSSEHAGIMRELVRRSLGAQTGDVDFATVETDASLGAMGLFVGQPTDANLASLYWAKPGVPRNPDPDRDGCGVIWLCPESPLLGRHIEEVVNIAQGLSIKHGFRPNIGIQCVNARCARFFIAIIYDRDESGRDNVAMRCHDEILSKLLEKGYFPFRLGLQSWDKLPRPDDASEELLKHIKGFVDPKGILAPNKYIKSS